jgi:hypothetical protein
VEYVHTSVITCNLRPIFIYDGCGWSTRTGRGEGEMARRGEARRGVISVIGGDGVQKDEEEGEECFGYTY